MKRRSLIFSLSGFIFILFAIPGATAAVKPVTPCVIGQTGPGGGTIFYDAGKRQKWGQCLEAAPVRWAGGVQDPKVPWCNVFNLFFSASIASRSFIGVAIGKGFANTNLLQIPGCSSGAGVLAHSYHGGRKSDWFLPSRNELHAMYVNRAVIGGFGVGVYWSSSENDANGAWVHYFKTDNEYLRFKGIPNSVRPIRAF
ncbi:MAG TPA: hypothetical protein VF307_07005 [Candidatus Nanopelagicaceae bacterium]